MAAVRALTTSEAALTRAFLGLLRDHGALAYKLNDRSTSGLPDAVVLGAGRSLWIECKREHEPLTVLQARTLLKLAQATDGRAAVVRFYAGRLATVQTFTSHARTLPAPGAPVPWTTAAGRLIDLLVVGWDA